MSASIAADSCLVSLEVKTPNVDRGTSFTKVPGGSVLRKEGTSPKWWNPAEVKTFQKALTRQISEAVKTRQRGEDLILLQEVSG